MSSIVKKENLFSSWKEIAAYLDHDVRTCRRWENDLGLPIHRIDERSKSSVFAYKDELDKWLDKRLNKKTITKNTFFRRFKWHKSFYLTLPIITAFFISLILIFIPRDSVPADFKIENSTLIILNRKGKRLWDYNTGIQNLLDEGEYRNRHQFKRLENNGITLPHIMIADINLDGRNEVLFSLQTQNEHNEGELMCFDNRGKCLWKFEGGRRLRFGAMDFSRDYRLKGFDIANVNNDDYPEIMIIFMHRDDFPTQFIILNKDGLILNEYWNCGRIKDFVLVDLNDDGKQELILSAMNNEYRKPALIVFDSTNVHGSSPQEDNFYRCDELEPGTEKYYILFPKIDTAIINGLMEPIRNVEVLENHILRARTHGSAIDYELNFNLELKNIRLGHTFELKYNKARRETKILEKLNRVEYKEKLKQDLLYYDGKNWVPYPAMSNPWQSRLK